MRSQSSKIWRRCGRTITVRRIVESGEWFVFDGAGTITAFNWEAGPTNVVIPVGHRRRSRLSGAAFRRGHRIGDCSETVTPDSRFHIASLTSDCSTGCIDWTRVFFFTVLRLTSVHGPAHNELFLQDSLRRLQSLRTNPFTHRLGRDLEQGGALPSCALCTAQNRTAGSVTPRGTCGQASCD